MVFGSSAWNFNVLYIFWTDFHGLQRFGSGLPWNFNGFQWFTLLWEWFSCCEGVWLIYMVCGGLGVVWHGISIIFIGLYSLWADFHGLQRFLSGLQWNFNDFQWCAQLLDWFPWFAEVWEWLAMGSQRFSMVCTAFGVNFMIFRRFAWNFNGLYSFWTDFHVLRRFGGGLPWNFHDFQWCAQLLEWLP